MSGEDLKSRVSIRSVIEPHVELKFNGKEWQGRCPFHKDSDPSFRVSDDKQTWNCFGCGKGGDIYSFVQEKHGVDFKAAKALIIEAAGLNAADFNHRPDPNAPPRVSVPESTLTDKRRPVAYYPYVDEKGAKLYEIVRFEWLEEGVRKKDFQQMYRDDSGAQHWKKHPRQVVYHLDKVIAADSVWFVEGEKCVAAVDKLGLVGTTIAGGARTKWLPTFTKQLAGKTVYIIPDNDEPGQSFAQKAFDKLSPVANVVVVRVPGEPKSDIVDWAAAGGTLEELQEIARRAEEAADLAKRQEYIGPKKEPNELAREILEKHAFISDESGFLYEYNGRYWEKAAKDRLKRYGMLFDSEHHTNQRRRGEIADFIVTQAMLPRVPWRQLALTEVPLLNGVFDVKTQTMRPHRQSDYLETVVPVAHDPEADCPIWRQCLWDYFGEDADRNIKMLALQQFFGYVLLPHAKYKKALILLGEGDSGKTEPLKLLENLVGSDNTCSVGVEDMDDPRARVPIVGKMLNKLSELSADSVIADGGFKTLISTQEAMLFDPKFVAPYMYSPFAKHVIVTNKLPGVNDLTKATYNRLLIVHFHKIIAAKDQDRTLTEKLKGEIAGVLNWALQGALDLIEHGGQFVEIPESSLLIEEYRRRQNDMNAFLDEETERVEGSYVFAKSVRVKYRSWSGRTVTDCWVGDRMAQAGFPSRSWPGDDSRRHFGLRWRTDPNP